MSSGSRVYHCRVYHCRVCDCRFYHCRVYLSRAEVPGGAYRCWQGQQAGRVRGEAGAPQHLWPWTSLYRCGSVTNNTVDTTSPAALLSLSDPSPARCCCLAGILSCTTCHYTRYATTHHMPLHTIYHNTPRQCLHFAPSPAVHWRRAVLRSRR